VIDQLPTLQNLLRVLQQIPYVASKNIYRVAHYVLTLDPVRREHLVRAIQELPDKVMRCAVCWCWYERDRACVWCSDTKRDMSSICVVQQWFDVYAMEKSGGHQGVYHVLGGAISPLDGIRPEDLSCMQLVERVQSGRVNEIILALSQTAEGDATAAYVVKLIERHCPSHGVRITCLSRGVPVGATLETLDRITLCKAFAERRPF
jgi:recombination protein RecR